MQDKDIMKVIMVYNDGTVKEVDEGLVVSMERDDEGLTEGGMADFRIDCCNISGALMQIYMFGILQLAAQLTDLEG